MSATVRAILASDFSGSRIKSFVMGREIIMLVLMASLLLASTLGIVYVRGYERQLTSQLQYDRQQYDEMVVSHSQLILEQATWSQQSRVQAVAEDKLGMQMPEAKNIVMVGQ